MGLQILGGAVAHHLLGAHLFVEQVTLSSGTATIDVSTDLTDGRELENTPYVFTHPLAAGVPNAGSTTRTTSTITVDDGSGANGHDVLVFVVEPLGMEPNQGH